MSTSTGTTAPSAGRRSWLLPLVQFTAVAAWLVWVNAPLPVIGGVWVDVLVPPVIFGLLFVGSVLVLSLAPPARGLLAWLGLSAVSVVLVLHIFFIYIIATFPDF